MATRRCRDCAWWRQKTGCNHQSHLVDPAYGPRTMPKYEVYTGTHCPHYVDRKAGQMALQETPWVWEEEGKICEIKHICLN